MSNQDSRNAVPKIPHDLPREAPAARKRLLDAVYPELRRLAASYLRAERPGHTLQPTALVHEAFLRLADQSRADFNGKTHFFAVGAQAMRRILVDHARSARAAKRGGDRICVPLDEALVPNEERDEDVLALEAALEKLAELDPGQAQLVELRFYGGLTVAEAAEVLEISQRTAEREWTMIRSWLRRELGSS